MFSNSVIASKDALSTYWAEVPESWISNRVENKSILKIDVLTIFFHYFEFNRQKIDHSHKVKLNFAGKVG